MIEIDISDGLNDNFYKVSNTDVTSLCSDPEDLDITYVVTLNGYEVYEYPEDNSGRMLYQDKELRGLVSLDTTTTPG